MSERTVPIRNQADRKFKTLKFKYHWLAKVDFKSQNINFFVSLKFTDLLFCVRNLCKYCFL